MIRIAFVGWGGSGKTEGAKYLANKYEGDVISFAFDIKYIDRYMFGTGPKDRERLIKIGESFRREFGEDIWIKRTMEHIIDENSNYFIDDLRRMNEYDRLVSENFHVIRIVADEDLRIERLIKRDGHCDVNLLYGESESGCAHLKLPEIENNGSFEEFYDKLDTYMMKNFNL